MTPIDLPPMEPSSIRPGGQWQPPPAETRTAAPTSTSDAWSITGAGWPVRPEEVLELLVTWPETRNIPLPQAVADLRQLFESSALDASDTDALVLKLQTILRGSTPESAATDWTAGLMNLLRSELTQLAQQAGAKPTSPADGLTQLLRHALTVLSKEGTPPPPAPRNIVPPTPPPPPLVRIAQNAGEQSYLISERETASGLLTQQPGGQTTPAANAARSPQEPQATPVPQNADASFSASNRNTNTPAAAPGSTTNPSTGTPLNQQAQAESPQQQFAKAPTPAQDVPSQAQTRSPPASPQPPGSSGAAPVPASSTSGGPPSTQTAALSPGTLSPMAPSLQPTVQPAPSMLPASEVLPLPTGPESEAAGSRVGTGTAAATSSSQASVNVPAPSLAEIIARVSSLQQQANSPSTIRWPFLISAGDESLPEGVSQRPDAQGDHTSGYSRSDTPTAASHASAGRGNPAGLNRANPAMPFSSTDTLNPSLAKDDARAELTGASIPASARAAEAAQNAIVPQQRVGLIPLMVGQEAMPAWVQMEWMPVDDREGREGEAKDRQALMVSVHIASETLGHVAFHLAWLPKELAGTIIIEKPDVLHAAQDELPDLETRLAESGLPPPRLRLLRHTAAPWQEETQEIDRT